MNKKVLATTLLCFSLALLLFPAVSASSSELMAKSEIWERTTYPTDTTLSLEELLGLPGYVAVTEEPIYLVDSMKTRNHPSHSTSTFYDITGIPPGGGGTRMPAPVYTMIIIDDDAETYIEDLLSSQCGYPVDLSWDDLCEWANNILEGGDDPFWDWFTINFVASQYRYWESPSGSLNELRIWGQQAFPKPAGIDVTFILTGIPGGGFGGFCDPWPGDAFIMTAEAAESLMPLVNLWQHEASHLYHAPDHDPGLTTWCIMSYWWAPLTRIWCSECVSEMAPNKWRFGSIYV